MTAQPAARAERGTYVVTKAGVSVNEGKSLTMGAGSKLKLANGQLDDGATGVSRCVRVLDGARFVGEVDGNRANQSKTAFNTAGGSNAGITHTGVYATGTADTPIKNLHVDARVTGVVDFPGRFDYVNDSYIRIRASDCGGAVVLQNCDNVEVDIEIDLGDNDDWKIYPHAVSMNGCTRIRGRIVIRGQRSDGTNALSTWFSGLTMIDCSDIEFDLVDAEAANITGQIPGVGVSLVGVRKINIAQMRIVGYSDILLELCGVVDFNFPSYFLDGRYAVSGDGVSSSGRGISCYQHALRGDFKGRTLEFTKNGNFGYGTVRRCLGGGVNLEGSSDTHWWGLKSTGNKIGLTAVRVFHDAGQAAADAAGPISGHHFHDSEFSFNERSGAEISDFVDGSFDDACRFLNNGQSRTYGSIRTSVGGGLDSSASGLQTRTSTNKTGLKVDAQADDTQNFTAPGFPDPNRATVIAVDRVERYGVGQTITITGAGTAGADLKVRVEDIVHDELTLSGSIVTFPAVTLTGTIAVTGTAVTGTSTTFNTDLVGRAFIKVGSEYRRVAKVTDNTHAVLDSAFSSNVSAGTTLQIVKATINGMPSQVYGMVFTADTLSPIITVDKTPTGNVTGTISNSTATATPLRHVPVSRLVSGYSMTSDSPMLLTGSTAIGYETTVYGNAGQNVFRRANGTASSPTAVLNGESLGGLSFRGYGTGFTGSKAFISAGASQTWTGSANGTDLVFQTTPNDSTTMRTVATITQGGRLVMPTTGSTGGLVLGGDATLYRDSTSVLKTDGALVVGSSLQLGTGAHITSGSGAPAAAATDGDIYIRTGTPGTSNQRFYVRSSGAWVGIL